MKTYQYDVYISYTGVDRERKNQIINRLGELGVSCYQSTGFLSNHFQSDFCKALDRSRVYLLVLSEALHRLPAWDGMENFLNLQREISLARTLETKGELKIAVLNLSESFALDAPPCESDDQLGCFLYANTRDLAQISGRLDGYGMLKEQTVTQICERCRTLLREFSATEKTEAQDHYDVYLSFEGIDRALKEQIGERFRAGGLSCYDADLAVDAKSGGAWCEALDRSRVYLMILSDGLSALSAQTVTEKFEALRREATYALELEARGELKIALLCASPFFVYDEPFREYGNRLKWFFYTYTRGMQSLYVATDGEGRLRERDLARVCDRCLELLWNASTDT